MDRCQSTLSPLLAQVFPYAADEYDFYAPVVVEALRARVAADEIAKLLAAIEDDRIFGRTARSADAPVDRLRDLGEAISLGTRPRNRAGPNLGPFLVERAVPTSGRVPHVINWRSVTQMHSHRRIVTRREKATGGR